MGSPARSIGILSERVALIDELTVEQNLALPLSLEVDDMPPELRRRVEKSPTKLASERRNGRSRCEEPVPACACECVSARPWRSIRGFSSRSIPMLRSHLVSPRFSADLAAVAAQRGLAMLVLTADTAFAASVCKHVLELRPASGELVQASRWNRWFARDGA